MANSLVCWRCGTSLAALSLPLRRLNVCKACNAELHVCKMCVEYDTSYAKHCKDNRRVALKVARPTSPATTCCARAGPGRDTASRGRRRPDHGPLSWHLVLVLELVQGLSVDRLLQDRRGRGERYDVNEALDLVIHVADALAVVHKAGLAHRDVKPAN